jgi:hypothetical protein
MVRGKLLKLSEDSKEKQEEVCQDLYYVRLLLNIIDFKFFF